MSVLSTQAAFYYLAQFVIGFVIGFILWHFSRLYKRPYLRSWCSSAFCFCVHVLTVACLIWYPDVTLSFHFAGSIISFFFNNLHILLMIFGTYEAAGDFAIDTKTRRWLVIGTALFSLIPPSLYAFDPQAQTLRYGLRTGSTEVITAVSFLFTGIILAGARRLPGSGSKAVAIGFLLYGGTHIYHAGVVFRSIMDEPISLSPMLGLVQIVLISVIGFGLIVWLLEDERVELQKTNDELDRFIYTTSHDLRAPIASVLGLVNIAKMELKETSSIELMKLIELRVKKLDQIIKDILTLSKTIRNEVKYEMVDFNKIVAETISDVKFLQGAPSISLRYSEDESNQFWGDYHQTKVVLDNLVSNAIKYHRPLAPDPFICISFKKMANNIAFEVTDNGEGIREEHREKIFDMFFRASANTDGTGLGLYIVKETLSKINGSITLKSEAGKGSAFCVTLMQPS